MIKEIIPAIVPDNITDIQLLKDGLGIFLDYLTEHSNISIDIKNILDQNKVPIYEEFVQIYLNNIWMVLTKSEHNEALYSKLKTMYMAAGIDVANVDLSVNPAKLLKEEYILTNKDYKSGKGTSKAMEYIYNIIIKSGIQADLLEDNIGGFRYHEGNPEVNYKDLFTYTIEGTMIEEMYDHFVKPLTHPVGWAYFYQRMFYMSFVDYFNIEFMYTFTAFEVRCMNGDLFEKDDYLANISHTGEQLVQDNTVNFVNVEYIGPDDDTAKKTTVYFKSGELLITFENPRSTILYDTDGNIKINYNDYDGNCGSYLDYVLEVISTTTDDISFQWATNLASTTGKHNVIGAGNVYVGAFIANENERPTGYLMPPQNSNIPRHVRDGYGLVNKDIPVTYKSYVGTYSPSNTSNQKIEYENYLDTNIVFDQFKWDAIIPQYVKDPSIQSDGAVQSRIFAAGGIDELDLSKYGSYWDSKKLNFDRFDFDEPALGSCTTKYDIVDITWDSDKLFDNFLFDNQEDAGCNAINSKYLHNLSGKTARDEYEIKQELVKCPEVFKDILINYDDNTTIFDNFNYDSEPLRTDHYEHLCENSFNDKFNIERNWDTGKLRFEDFNFDSEYVSEEFSIQHDKNMWDSDLYFDYFQFDEEYIGGGLSIRFDAITTNCPIRSTETETEYIMWDNGEELDNNFSFDRSYTKSTIPEPLC